MPRRFATGASQGHRCQRGRASTCVPRRSPTLLHQLPLLGARAAPASNFDELRLSPPEHSRCRKGPRDDRIRPRRAVRVGGHAESRATTPAPHGPQTRVSALELGVPARRGCRRKMPCVVWLVNDRCSSLLALEAGSPQSRRRQTRCPAGPTPWLADGSLPPTPGRRAEGASWVFFFTPFMGAPAPWPSRSPRAPLTLPQTDAGGRHGPALVLDFLSTRDSLSPSALTLRARSKSVVAWGSCGLGNQGRRTRRLSTTPPSSRA